VNEKRFLSSKINLIIYTGTVLVLGFFIISERYSEATYSFFMNPRYYTVVFVMLALIFIFIAFEERAVIIKKLFPWRTLYAVIYSPLIFYPLFRCYFQVPHIFCHVCPRRCIWGYLRPVTVPGVLLINLYNRTWCNSYCPLGSLQDEQFKLSQKKIDLPGFLSNMKYLILVLVIISYFWILNARRHFAEGNLFDIMFKGSYTTAMWAFIVALCIFIISFFVHRFWCNYICPIGTGSELLVRLENKLLRKL
jgi:hypothetical protein